MSHSHVAYIYHSIPLEINEIACVWLWFYFTFSLFKFEKKELQMFVCVPQSKMCKIVSMFIKLLLSEIIAEKSNNRKNQ